MSRSRKKERADVLAVRRGLAGTRSRAQAMILAGQLIADDQPVQKAGHLLPEDAVMRLRGEPLPYVSRAGLKLAKALDEFAVPAEGKTCLDVGASTGGFTDVLLSRDAARVHAVDVGRNQLAWKIRADERVAVYEGVNARYLAFETIGTTVDLIVMDVSFISVTKILPALRGFATPHTDWITLIKPQFEVGRDEVGKGGIVRSEPAARSAVERVLAAAETLGLRQRGLIDSPIRGTDGNREYLVHWRLHED